MSNETFNGLQKDPFYTSRRLTDPEVRRLARSAREAADEIKKRGIILGPASNKLASKQPRANKR